MKKTNWLIALFLGFILAMPFSSGLGEDHGNPNAGQEAQSNGTDGSEKVTVYPLRPWQMQKEDNPLRDEKRLEALVVKMFDLNSPECLYYRAAIEVNEQHIIVILFRKDTYSVDTVRVDLSDDFEVISYIWNYVRPPLDEKELAAEMEFDLLTVACPSPSVEAIISLGTPEFPSAVNAVDEIYAEAVAKGYYTVKLVGSQENPDAIKNWLSCPNLKFWGRVGHGDYDRLYLSGGDLTANYINSLPANYLTGTVVFANSCLAHNPPFEPAMLYAGVQKFVAGDTVLYVNASEEVFKCWSDKVITNGLGITSSLSQCAALFPYAGTFGISGTGADYLSLPTPMAPAAPTSLSATAYGSLQIRISWADHSDNEQGFIIERCTGSTCTNFAQIATVPANAVSYDNSGLSAGTYYRYRVRAYNSVGYSDYSNIASAQASPCTYSISHQITYFQSEGGFDAVYVTAHAGCPWTVSGYPAWISVNSGSSGLGNGTVSYSVAENTGPAPRLGPMAIAGKPFRVYQYGGYSYED